MRLRRRPLSRATTYPLINVPSLLHIPASPDPAARLAAVAEALVWLTDIGHRQ